tara:strand:- start:2396 stop:4900 length:2505 start_codon:yes stop_codon:yes gene_type:complete
MLDFGIKTHSIGRDGYVWWVGQIASEESWKENKPENPKDSNEDVKGFGERYRVAIVGYTPFNTQEVSDAELQWASVEYPVTAGSGGRGSSCSANLVQGDFVRGYFLDGEEGQIPIICAVIGKNEYQAITKNISAEERFGNSSGLVPTDYAAWYTQRIATIGDIITPYQTEGNGGNMFVVGQNESQYINSFLITNPIGHITDAATKAASEEPTVPLSLPSDCEPIPLGKIQKEIQNLIVEIQKINKAVYDKANSINADIAEVQEEINKKIAKATEFVASGIKWIFTEIQKFVIKTTNDTLKKTYFLLFPNERPGLKTAVENINDLIACLFRKLIKQLLSMIGNFLVDAASKVVNGLQCLVENVIGHILGKLIGAISDIINGALSAVSSLVGQAAGIVGEIVGIIKDILSFLSCEEKPQCSSVDEWNILSGASKGFSGDINSIINKAKNVAGSVQNIAGSVANSVESVGSSIDDALNMDFSDVFNQTGCNIGPVFCGPPTAQFFGLGGGAAGNLVVGSLGEVIGIDMINFGSGYNSDSYGKVYDNCGKGKGAYIRPIVSDYTDEEGNLQTGGITDIEIIEPGTGYLPAPNGSRGGNEYTWSDPDDTVIRTPDGSWLPIPPGEVVTVDPGTTITLPPGTVVITNPQPGGDPIISPFDPIVGTPGTGTGGGTGGGGNGDGNNGSTDGGQGGGETIRGGNPVLIELPGVFTTPKPEYRRPSGDYPTSSNGSYPVILYLCEVFIDESGINYSPGDKVIIEPDIGAVVEPKFNARGRLTSIKVTESGEGFTEYPTLYIQSETGYNAVLRPKLCIDRVGNDKLKEPTFQDKVITVIDCVGKV